jgi:hypothetical protein
MRNSPAGIKTISSGREEPIADGVWRRVRKRRVLAASGIIALS